MCSVESETLWNVLATASLTVAELRPGSGKKQLRRATPANPSGVGKPQRGARPRRSRRRSWARRMLLDGGYGERRSRAEGEMGGTTVAMRLFIAGMSSPGCDSARRRRHGDGDVPARGKAARTDRRRQAGGVKLLRWNFNLFTVLPLSSFSKLLSNFL